MNYPARYVIVIHDKHPGASRCIQVNHQKQRQIGLPLARDIPSLKLLKCSCKTPAADAEDEFWQGPKGVAGM